MHLVDLPALILKACAINVSERCASFAVERDGSKKWKGTGGWFPRYIHTSTKLFLRVYLNFSMYVAYIYSPQA